MHPRRPDRFRRVHHWVCGYDLRPEAGACADEGVGLVGDGNPKADPGFVPKQSVETDLKYRAVERRNEWRIFLVQFVVPVFAPKKC